MKNLSVAKSYRQCFICREWSWDVSRVLEPTRDISLCLPCYVDVLEVKKARGLMGEQGSEATIPGKSPSSFRQIDLFEDA